MNRLSRFPRRRQSTTRRAQTLGKAILALVDQEGLQLVVQQRQHSQERTTRTSKEMTTLTLNAIHAEMSRARLAG